MILELVDYSLISTVGGSITMACSAQDFLFAYIGPGSGLELIPQFLALLAFMATAFLAVMFQPIFDFYRFVRGKLTRHAPDPLASNPDGAQAESTEMTTSVGPPCLPGREEREVGSSSVKVSATPISELPSEGR